MRVETVNGVRYAVTPALPPRQVFCAEQPPRSDAHGGSNTGHGLVTAWLDPIEMNLARLAWLQLPDGRLVARPCAALRDPVNLAPRRILPAGAQQSRRMA